MTAFTPLSSNLIKKYSKLKQKKFRDDFSLCIAEGRKICEEVLNSDYDIEALIFDSGSNRQESENLINGFLKANIPIYDCDSVSFNKIADSKSPQNTIAIVKTKDREVVFNADKYICLEKISDPGNLGTIIRTGIWFGIENFCLSTDSVDCFNPKVIRSTMGAVFNAKISYFDDIYHGFLNRIPNLKSFGASLDADKLIGEISIPTKFALVFGNEADGLSDEFESKLDEKYLIPGSGEAESLNLAVSAGISIYHFCNCKK
jgi:TrmH family RNA methyltransferase